MMWPFDRNRKQAERRAEDKTRSVVFDKFDEAKLIAKTRAATLNSLVDDLRKEQVSGH